MSERISDIFRITEATVIPNTRMMEITIIRKGFGNPVGGRYYPSKLMQESASKFNGHKMYADHDTPQAQKQRSGQPRSVKDLVATIKESWYDPNTDAIKAKVKVIRDWFWEIVSHDPTAVGVSIDAFGTGRNGVVEGKQAKIVESLTQINSADFVTEAGAGGGIDKLLEAKLEANAMGALDNLTAEMVREHRQDIVDEIIKESETGNPPPKKEEKEIEKVDIKEAVNTAVEAAVAKERERSDKKLRIMENRNHVRDHLAKSGLAIPSQAAIARDFHDADFEDEKEKTGRERLTESLDMAIKEKREEIAAYGKHFAISGMGPGNSFSKDGNNNDEGGKSVSLKEAAPAHVQLFNDLGIKIEEAETSDEDKKTAKKDGE